METSGFYKNDDGMILYGPNYVEGGSYNIYRQNKDEYNYPISGWYWFDSKEEAYSFWGIPLPPDQPEQPFVPPLILPTD